MLVTLIVIASLLAGAVVLVAMQIASNKSTDLTRQSTLSLYCAEAGIHAARSVVGSTDVTNKTAAILASSTGDYTEPSWLSTGIGSHDIDGDGVADFHVYLLDNDDELATGGTNNLAVDVDNQVWVISVCDKYTETPKTVSELVQIATVNGTMYDWQAGGAFGNNNYNFQNTTR
jgi:hypothetical protein